MNERMYAVVYANVKELLVDRVVSSRQTMQHDVPGTQPLKRNNQGRTPAQSLPLSSLFAQNLGHSIHDSQVGAQSVMQTLVVNPGLRLRISQSSLAFYHTLSKPAACRQLLSSLGGASWNERGGSKGGNMAALV